MENQDFGKYDWVLFLTPLGSLILKPKKHQVEYLTLIISLGYLMINQFTSHDINYGLKTLMLFIIYVVFLLPVIKSKIRHLIKKSK